MSEPQRTDDERAAEAFRGAIATLDAPTEVDPARARHEVRRWGKAGLVAAGVVALVAFFTLPAVLHTNFDPLQVFANPGQESGPWRTEHYRDITFSVPSSWPYGFEPNTDCADLVLKHGYVTLEGRWVTTTEGCSRNDESSTLNEHVLVAPRDGYWSEPPRGSQHIKGWWLTEVDIGEVRLRAVSRDRAVVDRIVASAKTVTASSAGLCAPHHALERDSAVRPSPRFDVARVAEVDSITLCQYDPQESDVHTDPGLVGQAVLSGDAAARLLASIQQAQPYPAGPCRPVQKDEQRVADLAVVLYLQTRSQTHTVYLSAAGCKDRRGRAVGGFDDGTTVRRITRESCQDTLVPPLQIYIATEGQVADACMG